jgi:hypothetical protein
VSDGFDRIKPPERRLIERAAGPRLDSEDADAEGRAALFTAGPARDRERARERAAHERAGREAAGREAVGRGGAGRDGAGRDGGGREAAGRERRGTERPAADPQGGERRAAPGAGADRGSGAGGLAVHCSRCDATSPLDAGTAVRSALPLFLVVPWRDHPVFAICPACRHRAWLRIET